MNIRTLLVGAAVLAALPASSQSLGSVGIDLDGKGANILVDGVSDAKSNKGGSYFGDARIGGGNTGGERGTRDILAVAPPIPGPAAALPMLLGVVAGFRRRARKA